MNQFNEDDEEDEDDEDGWVEKEPQTPEHEAEETEVNATWFNYNTNVGGW